MKPTEKPTEIDSFRISLEPLQVLQSERGGRVLQESELHNMAASFASILSGRIHGGRSGDATGDCEQGQRIALSVKVGEGRRVKGLSL